MIEEIKIDRLEELIHEMMKKIHDAYPTESAEGNPIEIDNAAAAPLVKCVTAITGSQSGSGTPSPDNVRPITAYASGTIEVEDENNNSITYGAAFPIAIYRGSADYVKKEVTCTQKMIVIDENSGGEYSETYDCYLLNTTEFEATAADNLSQFLSNRLAARRNTGASSMNNEFLVNGNGNILFRIQGFHSLTDYNTWLSNNPLQIVGLLKTSTTSSVSITNTPIKSLSGYNRIESSTGDMEVEYIREQFQGIVNIIPEIKVNPSGDATATLSKMEVDGVIYGLPE